MLVTLLMFLSNAALRSPWKVIATFAIPSLLLGAFALTVPIDLSFTGLLDRSDREVDLYYSTLEKLKLGGALPLLFEGENAAVEASILELAPKLRAHDDVKSVLTESPTEWLTSNAPFLVDAPTFQQWIALATRPDDVDNAKALATTLKKLGEDAQGLRGKGVRIIIVTLHKGPMSTSIGGGEFESIQRLTNEVLAGHPGVKAGYGGLAAIAAQDQSQTIGMVRKLTPLTLLLVLLLLRLVEPDFRRLLAVAVPMVLSVGGTLGIVGLLTGKFTVLESLFGIMVFGLGIDFALHLIVRAREETARGKSFDDAIVATWIGAGRGIIAGAFTTAGAFFIVAAAPDVSAQHLGLSGGVGLLFCLLLMLTVLPSLWVILHRRGISIMPASKDNTTTKNGRPTGLMAFTFLRKIAAQAAIHPIFSLAFAAVLFAGAIAGLPHLRFETDLEKVFNREIPAIGIMNKVQDVFGINSNPWIIALPTLEETRSVHDAFVDDETFGRVESLATILRPDRNGRAKLLQKNLGEIETQLLVYKGLIPLVTDDEAKTMKGGIKLLEILRAASENGPPDVTSLPPILRQRLVAPDGSFIVYAYAAHPDFDGYNSIKRRQAAQAIHPDTTGLGALLGAILGLDRPWAAPVFLGILAFVAFLLAIDLRRWKLIVLALIPVVWATTMTLGILCWLDLPMNVLMTAVVPLIIGLGVDDGIHVVHRIREDPTLTVDIATESVGRAILMTTVTTCVSFSALLFTNHAGMEGMGLVMIIGLPLCLFASVTTLPAAAVLLKVASPPEQ